MAWVRMSGGGKKREVKIVEGGTLKNGTLSGNGMIQAAGLIRVNRPSGDAYNGGAIINIANVTGFNTITVRAVGKESGYGYLRVSINGVIKAFPANNTVTELDFNVGGTTVNRIDCVMLDNIGTAAIYEITAHN